MEAFLEIHREDTWRRAALLQGFGDDRCRLEYLPEYIFGKDPVPISLTWPVGFAPEPELDDGTPDRRVPPFLFDVVPQGKGRQFLIGLLNIADSDQLVMPLLFNGAFNPIGCLRISSAVEFYKEQVKKNPDGASNGFTLEDMKDKSEDFLDHMSIHAMLAAGTTGVQGIAPKYLLTSDDAGRYFADLALPDAKARDHWLVKLPRGSGDTQRLIHRNELAYLKLAQRCGLRVLEDAHLVGDMLFMRRFDRARGPKGTVARLHQESLASLAGIRGFGQTTTQNILLAALREHVTDPYAATLEFLKRDVLNLAMRNTDNHARNTAVQRLSDGTVRLTPLYDFGPMFLDPDVVPRATHWRDQDDKRLDTWSDVFAHLVIPSDERQQLAEELVEFRQCIAALPDLAKDCGVESEVLDKCSESIKAQWQQLGELAHRGTQ